MLGRGALGLRGRIVGVVLVTTVATLVVAALALLGPLETKLRTSEFTTFQRQLDRAGTTAPFAAVSNLQDAFAYKLTASVPPTGAPPEQRDFYIDTVKQIARARDAHAALVKLEEGVQTRIGASEVALLGYSPAANRFTVISSLPPEVSPGQSVLPGDTFGDAIAAYYAQRQTPIYQRRSIGGTEYALAALPFDTPSTNPRAPYRWVLVVRRPFAEVTDAVRTVRTAFLDAALAGLALTLILAIPLSFRVVRRLRRLREAALQLAEGRSDVTFRTDRVRDEVGDLARTFALMQRQLRQQEEARRAFVATASHELRTPLTSLEGMLELLEDDLAGLNPDIVDARSLVARARAQSHRLGRLAADLLDLSRLDAQVALRSEPVELSELSRAVLAEFELGTHERRIVSELHDAGAPVWALGDPGSVARILRILLDNAVRVSPPDSEIVVELHDGGRATLSVRDHGPGVPPDERELIFERFQRGRSTSGQAGFGLGLAIGRELAQRMGGELVLEDAPGPGATFTLRLPVAAAPHPDTVAAL